MAALTEHWDYSNGTRYYTNEYGERVDQRGNPVGNQVSKQQPVKSTAVEARQPPPNVTILKGHERIGTAHKDRYLSHVADLWSGGFMTDTEHEARRVAIEAAEVNADLNLLISDLPPLPMTAEQKAAEAAKLEKEKKVKKQTKKWRKNPWNKAGYRLTAYVVGMVLSLCLITVPWFVTHKLPFSGVFGAGNAFSVICTVVGSVSLVALVIWTIYWLMELVDWKNNSANKNYTFR